MTRSIDEKTVLSEIESLRDAHKNSDYFRVVLLAPQLIVQIIDLCASNSEDWIDRKIVSNFSNDDREVYRLVGQLQKQESDRSYIVGALVELYEIGFWDKSKSKREFVKYFTQITDLVDLRNIYAHEYYAKNVSSNRARNCSKAAIRIIDMFSSMLQLSQVV